MRVNEKFPRWMSSGGVSDASYTGLVSNIIYPYFDTADRPVFQIPYSSDVFPSITYGEPAKWLSSLDVMFATRYGERHLVKWLSDMDIHNNSAQSVTADQKDNTRTLAQMINLRFSDKWNHIAEALGIEYDPLENYNRVENSSFNKDGNDDSKDVKSFGKKFDSEGALTDGDDRTSSKDTTGQYSDADNTTVTEINGKEKLILEKVSGFDSSDSNAGIEDAPGVPSTYQHIIDKPIDADGYEIDHGGDITRTYGTVKDGKTIPLNETTTESGDEAFQHNGSHGESGWNHGQVSGNIGVTTSQQMLTQELEVRKNMLYDIILRDIADFICLSIY